MTHELAVRNVRLPDSDTPRDIFVDGGKISAITLFDADNAISAARIVDGEGCFALPGFIDLHVHFRDPGFTYKEDILSGSRCAAAGGVTSVFCMPNTMPVCDTPEVVSYILEKAKRADCRVFPVGAITRGLGSRELCDFAELKKAGAAAFSDDGKPVADAETFLRAAKMAMKENVLLLSHCEDMSLSGGAMNEGAVSERLGVKGVPSAAEDIGTLRDIAVAEYTGCRLHICHVSTRGSVEAVRQAKRRGVNVSAETCPHYFAFTEEDVPRLGTIGKMSPPLRTRADVEAVIEGLADGTIDWISTDHAPHSDEEKSRGLEAAPNGIIGLQTSFSASYTYLVKPGHVTLTRLLELMSGAPARITGLDKKGFGRLADGCPADIALVSTDKENALRKADLRGKSSNSPFIGVPLFAEVERTFVGGREVFAREK